MFTKLRARFCLPVNKMNRFFSIDVLRGVAIAIMIIVDAPPAITYQILHHAPWEGLTFADFAFPGFVFAMGISAAISVSRNKPDAKKILKRTIILFALGIFLNALMFFFLNMPFRIFGILQRLALTYALGIFIALILKTDRKIFAATFFLLIFYSTAFKIYAPENPFEIGKNIFDAIDTSIIGAENLLTPTHDPEGLFGTISSAAQMLLGFIAGQILIEKKSINYKIYLLASCAGIFAVSGWLWTFSDIICKNLWTSAFVFLTSAVEFLLLAILLRLTEKKSAEKFFKPLAVLGKNPLLYFFCSQFGLIFFYAWKIENISAWRWIFQHTISGFVSAEFSSMLFCLIWLVIWIFIATAFDKLNLIIKI